MDINRENYELGLPVIEKAGVAHKIEFKEGPALPVLDLMIEDVRNTVFDIEKKMEMERRKNIPLFACTRKETILFFLITKNKLMHDY